MTIEFFGLPTADVARIRASGRDAYGLATERHVANADAFPCRHCLGATPPGRDYLVLAHRPFERLHAYSETGPIFLCADACAAYTPSRQAPTILRAPRYLIRGYTPDERILYGTGDVVATSKIAERAAALLEDPRIAFVDVRSAANNCFQCRVRRAV